ncbi:hypothetical protein IQ227_14495 [Anabaena aphanizomenioides LEGE 00250]|uniref:Uncharacterized protein n=1 Tax=Sphaerospermopsis aphanizomenoides LEGE 00250 TaxID=2777972 RepID=A0ABR9VFC5_9CYAN|nr:hypothetical protein [Sphaerospermopsis aphanizomenoides]MBE9237203.1 hypothetical protein [Sphaerospermopsis aphanizomenoides LEGE 00250]
MLKSLLLSGWFRVQPFFKYVIVVILIAPLVGVSIHSSIAKQSHLKVGKISTGIGQSDSNSQVTAIAGKNDLKIGKVNSLEAKFGNFGSVNKPVSQAKQVLQADKINSGAGQQNQHSNSNLPVSDILAVVKQENLAKIPTSQRDLIQKLKDVKSQTLQGEVNSLERASLENEVLKTSASTSNIREPQPSTMMEIPVNEQQQQYDTVPDDPINSPHPIPWKWIMMTQEAIGGKGGSGVRHYRSIPVVSPDGRYAVYSRVQLEIQPEMHNSRVTSLLFIEDRQTKRLRVMSKTAAVGDPLLDQQISDQADTQGKIGVLVPVSWSEKGDRFLARKFVGMFNTADLTDHAVIWERQENHTQTVAPAQGEDEHEKIAILLGWSKKQPDHVLFRAGELGEENWPLVQVASDGKTINVSNDGDQPVTFGTRDRQVWAEPQVASR